MICKDKVAIVTGAAGNGLWRSIALTLAREGVAVVVNYLTSSDSAAAIVSHIEKQGGRALAFQADITQQDQCTTLVDAAIDNFRQVDICIIGSGAGWHPEPPGKLDSTAALDDVQKELVPIYNLMPLVLPGMYQKKWGRLITLALVLPYDSPAYFYNVAKVARTHAFQLAQGSAWTNGVTLNTVGLGPIPPIDSLEEAVEQCEHGPAWLKRTTTSPQDIAESAGFLYSDAGRFISGAVILYLLH